MFPRQLQAFIKHPLWGDEDGALAEMVDIGARIADDEKRRVSYIIISKNKVLRLLCKEVITPTLILKGLFMKKRSQNYDLFLTYANKFVNKCKFNRKLI